MRLNKWICPAGLLLTAGLCCPSLSMAQSSAFPAYVPPQEKPAAQVTSGFPKAETSLSSKALTVQKASFPKMKVEESAQDTKTAAVSVLNEASLSAMLTSMGLQPRQHGQRFDVMHESDLGDQEIELFFTLQLNQDKTLIRLRAWLDELPEGEIPDENLLELLTANAEMSAGMHFGFSKSTSRFMLEQTLKNRDVSEQDLKKTLDEIAHHVADTQLLWSTSEWIRQPEAISRKLRMQSREAVSDQAFEMPIMR